MGPKKKVQDDDQSTEKLVRIYRGKCEKYGVPVSKLFKEKVEEALEGDPPHLKKLLYYDQVGPVGVKAIFQALCEQDGYKHLQSLNLTNIKTKDEGCQYIAQYLQKSKSVKELELEINDIGAEGCKFLGAVLLPSVGVPLVMLNLSYNKFGTAGLEMLSRGLAVNNTIQKLYLDYCEIDPEGSRYIQEILSFHESVLEVLSLNGNCLRNEGVFHLFRGIQANTALSELYLMNNQFGESPQIFVVDKICNVLTHSMTLIYVNLEGNGLYNESGKKFVNVMKYGNPLLLIQFGINCEKDVMDDFKKLAKKRKKKKKKKGKKGKKGKKK